MQKKSKGKERAAPYRLLFVLLLLPYAYFNHSDGWNQSSRLAELHAVVLKHSLRIDAYEVMTGDKALVGGHYYSEKAPAIALLALPAFALTAWTQSLMGIDPDSEPARRVSDWTATAGSLGVLVALGGVAFFALLRPRVGDRVALLSTVALFLGSLVFPYATALFAHAGTVALLTVALWAVLDEGPTARQRAYVGGTCAGLAFASEYPAIIPVAVLFSYLAYLDRDRARRFALALIPGVLLILFKNFVSTGSPFQLLYGFNPQFPHESAAQGFGHTLPHLNIASALLWSEYRGLFFWNPILLMALPGAMALVRVNRAEAVMILTAIALCFLEVTSFRNWYGGNAIGPRYLSSALPFLGFLAAYGIGRLPRTGAMLAIVSVALMAMVTAVTIDPAQDVRMPLEEIYLVRLEQGRFSPNLGTLAGLSSSVSLLLLAAVTTMIAWRIVVALRRPERPAER
jgi:hypothetical protein